jgi:hypothetical protein
MKPLRWKDSPKILISLANDYLLEEELSLRNLAIRYLLQPSTVSRWLSDPRIVEVVGSRTYELIKIKRLSWKKSNIPCPLYEVDSGAKVRLFRQGSEYASYGPVERSTGDIDNSTNSLVRWPLIELESIIFALCWHNHTNMPHVSLWDFIFGFVTRIEVKFARRGASLLDIERLLTFAKSYSLRHRNSFLSQDLLPLTRALTKAESHPTDSYTTIAVAQALLDFYTDKKIGPVPWLIRLFEINPYTKKITSIRSESKERYIKVFWHESFITEPFNSFHAEISPEGKVEGVLAIFPSGKSLASADFSIAVEQLRKKHLHLMSKPFGGKYVHYHPDNLDPCITPIIEVRPAFCWRETKGELDSFESSTQEI